MHHTHVILEVCIDSVAGALAATRGGADRVELCSALSEGGLTPSLGLVRQVQQATSLPIMVMIRPCGGTFVYSPDELNVMLADIGLAKEAGVQGVVCGALNPEGQVDQTTCEALVQRARPLEVTFHRALDAAVDAEQAVECIVRLGFDRVLTSGQCRSAEEGIPLLHRLVDRFGRQVAMMPGAGVRPGNVQRIVSQTGAREIHASASTWIDQPNADPLREPDRDPMCPFRVTSEEVVRQLRIALDG